MSNTPGHDLIVKSLEAMRTDAQLWRTTAGVLTDAATQAADLRLDQAAFSFMGGELASAYARLQTKLVTLLQAGSANATSVATALTDSASTYATEEAANVHQIRNVY